VPTTPAVVSLKEKSNNKKPSKEPTQNIVVFSKDYKQEVNKATSKVDKVTLFGSRSKRSGTTSEKRQGTG
jgi:electron transfer flavoprotein alpha/beta subunit